LKIKLALPVIILCLGLVILASVPSAWAHTHRVVMINGQEVEFVVGWVNEPPYAGEINAVDFWAHYVNATCPQGAESTSPPCPVYGLDQSLRVAVTTGGQSQVLSFAPNLSDDIPPLFYGEYTAEVEPTVPGSYSFTIFGTVGSTNVNQTFVCGPTTFECVDPANEIQFPQSTASTGDLQTALSNAQSQISSLQSQVTQLQGTVQTAFAVAGVGVAVGIIGLVAAAVAISRGRGRATPRRGRKRT